MRTIKFRGKDEKGEWHYGNLLADSCVDGTDAAFISPGFPVVLTAMIYRVGPATIGQFTGVCDCDLEPIYEGDLLMSLMLGDTFEVVYEAPRFCVKNEDFGTLFINDTKQWKVVGNVHDGIEEKGGEE